MAFSARKRCSAWASAQTKKCAGHDIARMVQYLGRPQMHGSSPHSKDWLIHDTCGGGHLKQQCVQVCKCTFLTAPHTIFDRTTLLSLLCQSSINLFLIFTVKCFHQQLLKVTMYSTFSSVYVLQSQKYTKLSCKIYFWGLQSISEYLPQP